MVIEHFRHIFASLLTKINFEMKNLSLLLAGVALVALTTTSCKKIYTCNCTAASTDATVVENVDWYDYENTVKLKKADAEDACAVVETAAQYYDAEATCVIE